MPFSERLDREQEGIEVRLGLGNASKLASSIDEKNGHQPMQSFFVRSRAAAKHKQQSSTSRAVLLLELVQDAHGALFLVFF